MQTYTGNTMSLKHFHDFYFLEALQAGMSMAKSANPELQFKHSFERLENDIAEAFSHLCESMAKRIHAYLWAATLGEVRHASRIVPMSVREITYSKMSDRNTVYRISYQYEPTTENMQVVRDVYNQKGWGGTYGGTKWMEITDGMMMYGKVSNATFIDHAVDLEHNGGNIFTKNADCVGLNVYEDNYYASMLRSFLDYKFSHDILNDPINVAVSRKVYSLIVRFNNVVNPINAQKYVRPTLEWLSEYNMLWQDGTLSTTGSVNYSTIDERNTKSCEICGEEIDANDHYHLHGDCVCRECYENSRNENMVTCENCNDIVHVDCTYYADGENETWCDSCYSNYHTTCESCEKDFHDNHIVQSEDGYSLCNECAEENACSECGEIHYNDMGKHDEENHKTEPVMEYLDADGILQYENTFDWSGVLYHQKSFKGYNGEWENEYVWDLVDKGLFIQDIGAGKTHNYKIVIPCGTWTSISDQGNLQKTIATALKMSEAFDWNTIQTIQDWTSQPSEIVEKIMKIIKGA